MTNWDLCSECKCRYPSCGCYPSYCEAEFEHEQMETSYLETSDDRG